MAALKKYLQQLQALPDEAPIEPELKPQRQKQDKRIREEQDLAGGAVMYSVVEEGEGGASPCEGDMAFIHFSVRSAAGALLYSTRGIEGGSGQPLAFMIGKGRRAPRGWELALLGMSRRARKVVRVGPAYGFSHPDCRMAPPRGVDVAQALSFDIELLDWVDADKVRATGDDDDLFKVVLAESDHFEMARPPNEATFTLKASALAPTGGLGGGEPYFAPPRPLSLPLGAGALPAGAEAALATMAQGERAVVLVPAALMAPETDAAAAAAAGAGADDANNRAGGGGGGAPRRACIVPPPPAGAAQVQLELELLELIQVRDMAGDGGVLKRRVRPGQGEFPVDCPLHDTTVRIHYRVRPLRGDGGGGDAGGGWAFDSQAAGGSGGGGGGGGGAPLEVDTGCGELPEAVELCARLMVPGELARAVAQPRYAYQGREDAPAGVRPEDVVEFEVELVDFQREGHWHDLPWPERWALLERLKGRGNALHKAGKFRYAANRYQRILHLVDSTRDFEDEETSDRADAFKLAALGNLALSELGAGEAARAAEWCDKALRLEPGNAKFLFRKGRALSLKGDHEEADGLLAEAAAADASLAADAERERAANKQRMREAAEKQRKGMAAFSFGQAPSTPGFGAPASQPAFGGFGAAAPAPAFGAAPAASSGGFSFGGGAAASTPAFGAPASGGGFSFGGGAAPAFGAASSGGGGLFGGGAAPAFGAPAAASSSFGGAAPGSLFGAPANTLAQSGPSLGGLFGAPAASGAVTIFGAAAAPAAAPAAAATQFAPVALSSGGAAGGPGGAGADAARELQEIANCYTPGHSSYKFSHLFLSVARPEQRARPPGVDELSWKQALKEAGGEDNPEGLWPVQANGFGDLLKRAQAQAAAADENRQRLSELRDLAHKLGRRQEGEIRGRIRALLARHVELSQRLLGVARCVDGLEGRLAMYMGARGDISREREASISRTLDGVEGELSLAAAGGLQRRADVVAAAVRLRASGGGAAAGGGGGAALDEASMAQLFEVLQDHADALTRLQEVLRRDTLDASVLRGGPRDLTAPAALGTAVWESA
ncbi:MAG: hypothetical protein J3K34DRAFT_512676 [Monoraphidium minutum]|nr:MAG: hypothetical protein J3K34DRAFT_512676 [Monoraphidium minutum]